jgi:hypothetical protein
MLLVEDWISRQIFIYFLKSSSKLVVLAISIFRLKSCLTVQTLLQNNYPSLYPPHPLA